MTPTKEQIEEAIDWIYSFPLGEDAKTALFALKFLERAMGEPSDEMNELVAQVWFSDRSMDVVTVYKAMTQQLLKEVSDDE